MGSEDEHSSLAKDIARFWGRNEWVSTSGVSYRENLRNIRCPMLLIFSSRDTTIPVDYAERFFAPCAPLPLSSSPAYLAAQPPLLPLCSAPRQ